jgi:hypothetical protein
MRIDFFVAGFSKCGTTTLCAILGEHPGIFVPEEKEPNFFAHSFDHGWDWYAKFFAGARQGQRLGEGSTFYSSGEYAEIACRRIVEHFPEARFIFIARNPIKRLESSYRELHHSGATYAVNAPYSIGQALRECPAMIDDTLYWQRLSSYRKYVPDDRILPMLLEDFQRQPAVELARCFKFLGVDPSVRIENLDRRLNPGAAKLYDSRLMRFIRTHGWTTRLWNRLSEPRRAQLTKALGLRKPFKGPVQWDAETRAWLIEQIGDDARRFLAHCGKPVDYWELFRTSSPASRRG